MCKSMQRFSEELKSFEREQKSADFFILLSQNNHLCIFAFNNGGLSEMWQAVGHSFVYYIVVA